MGVLFVSVLLAIEFLLGLPLSSPVLALEQLGVEFAEAVDELLGGVAHVLVAVLGVVGEVVERGRVE